jgi:hypothetical protein
MKKKRKKRKANEYNNIRNCCRSSTTLLDMGLAFSSSLFGFCGAESETA